MQTTQRTGGIFAGNPLTLLKTERSAVGRREGRNKSAETSGLGFALPILNASAGQLGQLEQSETETAKAA